MKYEINKNIDMVLATIDDLDNIKSFQKTIIDNMPNKTFFTALTDHEFIYPIKNNGKVYLLYHNKELIGLFVLTTFPEKDILKEYMLEDYDVSIFDSVMIKENYRGSNLQLQGMKILNNDAKKMNIKKIVATIHPENKYSLKNFIKDGYKIIKEINIHNGPRYIVMKNINTKED